jgi:type I restriction enzyme S subunit
LIESIVEQVAAAGIRGSDLARLIVPVPPLPTQRAIAHVLGTLDDLIELNQETNVVLEEIARALFKSWFVDFDPVRSKLEGRPPAGMDAATAALFPDHFQDSELGQIPKGWSVGRFGDVCANSRQGVSPDAINPDTPYIGLEHMPRRSIALAEWETAAKVSSGKSAFNKGEILFGKLRPYFHKVGVAPVDGVCSTDILVLLPKVPDWFGFVLGHASSDALVQFADQASAGTKMPRTNWKDLSSFKMAIPPQDVASAFSRFVRPQVETIQANIHESRDLATLRDTLLPKLLSGELSLSEPN